jgi:hypothetical protein
VALQFVLSERGVGKNLIHGLPVWVVQAFLPLGFGLIALRYLWRSGEGYVQRTATLALTALLVCAVMFTPVPRGTLVTTGIVVAKRDHPGRARIRGSRRVGAAAVLGRGLADHFALSTTIGWW